MLAQRQVRPMAGWLIADRGADRGDTPEHLTRGELPVIGGQVVVDSSRPRKPTRSGWPRLA